MLLLPALKPGYLARFAGDVCCTPNEDESNSSVHH